MRFNFITLFPERIQTYFSTSLPAKARQRGILEIHTLQLRDFSDNKHKKVDDTIYGGGPGMLLQIPPIYNALESLGSSKGYVILLSAGGEIFTQSMAEEFLQISDTFTFISGYYEGVDARVSEHLVDREVSIGKYVISSGDLAALVVADCLSRKIPGFLGKPESLEEESHNLTDVLEYPQYTKPREFMGWKVPDVLVEGNHREIQKWRSMHKKQRSER